MGRGATLAVAMLTCAACGSAAAVPKVPADITGHTINVAGTLDRGPIATCPPDEPCDPPLVGSMLVFSRPGVADASVRVAPDGSFALHLDPGAYSIAAAPPSFQGRLEPSTVRVPMTGTIYLQLRIVAA